MRGPLWERAVDVIRRDPPPYEGCFLHRDFHPGNVLFTGAGAGLADQRGRRLGGDLVGAGRPGRRPLLHGPRAPARPRTRPRLPGRYEAHGGRRLADGPDHLYWRLLDALAYFPDAAKLGPWRELGRTDLTPEVLGGRLEAYVAGLLRRTPDEAGPPPRRASTHRGGATTPAATAAPRVAWSGDGLIGVAQGEVGDRAVEGVGAAQVRGDGDPVAGAGVRAGQGRAAQPGVGARGPPGSIDVDVRRALHVAQLAPVEGARPAGPVIQPRKMSPAACSSRCPATTRCPGWRYGPAAGAPRVRTHRPP